MKYSYLCIVRRKIESGAQGSQKLFSGLANFTACPERKKKGSRTNEYERINHLCLIYELLLQPQL